MGSPSSRTTRGLRAGGERSARWSGASLGSDDDLGGLDDRDGRLADPEPEPPDRGGRDEGRDDDLRSDLDDDSRRHRPFIELDDPALELIAGAELHAVDLR